MVPTRSLNTISKIDYPQRKANGAANALSKFSQKSTNKEEVLQTENTKILQCPSTTNIGGMRLKRPKLQDANPQAWKTTAKWLQETITLSYYSIVYSQRSKLDLTYHRRHFFGATFMRVQTLKWTFIYLLVSAADVGLDVYSLTNVRYTHTAHRHSRRWIGCPSIYLLVSATYRPRLSIDKLTSRSKARCTVWAGHSYVLIQQSRSGAGYPAWTGVANQTPVKAVVGRHWLSHSDDREWLARRSDVLSQVQTSASTHPATGVYSGESRDALGGFRNTSPGEKLRGFCSNALGRG